MDRWADIQVVRVLRGLEADEVVRRPRLVTLTEGVVIPYNPADTNYFPTLLLADIITRSCRLIEFGQHRYISVALFCVLISWTN